MAVVIPSIILVLDISTLSNSSASEWMGFSRVGACHLPQVVYDEIRGLFDRSADPDLERIARDFSRFYGRSGWKITEVTSHHPSLKAASGQALTQRSRIGLAVARTAYGLAQQHPGHLVVLVANERLLLQRLYEINVANLSGITGQDLLQWSQTGRRPVAISQKLQQLRSQTEQSGEARSPEQAVTPKKSAGRTNVTVSPTRQSSVRRAAVSMPSWLPEVITGVTAIAGLALAAFLVWRIFFQNS